MISLGKLSVGKIEWMEVLQALKLKNVPWRELAGRKRLNKLRIWLDSLLYLYRATQVNFPPELIIAGMRHSENAVGERLLKSLFLSTQDSFSTVLSN